MSILKNIFNKFTDIFSHSSTVENNKKTDTEKETDIFYDTTSFKVFKKPQIVDLPKTEKMDLDTPTEDINLKEMENEEEEEYWWKAVIEEDPTEDIYIIEGFNVDEVEKELRRRIDCNEFPVIEIPSTVMQTLQILDNPDFDYGEVANLINKSPAMAGEFIKIINSSVYKRGTEITDLRSALPRLGKANIKAMLFMYSSKLNLANHPLFNDLAVSIVEHSYAAALTASFLSQRYFPDPEMAFLAGLLHDIGKLGILKALSELYELPVNTEAKISEYSFGSLLNSLHPSAGFYLGKKWSINKAVLSALKHHHDFFDTTFTEETQVELHLAALVNLSDTIARLLGKGTPIPKGKIDIFAIPACNELNMEPNKSTIEFLENIPEIIEFKMK